MSSVLRAILATLVLLVASCTPTAPQGDTSGPATPSGPASPSMPAGSAVAPGAVAAPPAPPASPPSLPVISVEARFGGNAMSLQVAGSEPPVVDPGSTFEIRLPFSARGARMVLLDARDALVPASTDAEVGTTSRFTLVPLEPLPPGSRHVLRLEGLESRLVVAADGRSFEPLVAPFRVAGEPSPAPPKRAKKKRGG